MRAGLIGIGSVHPEVDVAPRVQLFATCLGDLIFPDAVADAATLIRSCGVEVEFPSAQICCGQPAFNAGHRRAARRVAKTFERAFSRRLPVVVPAGSCAAMIALRLPDLLGSQPYEVFELSVFLERASPPLSLVNQSVAVGYHASCHLLRELHVDGPPQRLLERTGARVLPLRRPDLCCGFGGTFSVRQPEVSVAMADDKLASASGVSALVTADPGCLMHLSSRSLRVRGPRVVHLATALARGIEAA
jgi:L-lactate dehydrogenase complex protein LldE